MDVILALLQLAVEEDLSVVPLLEGGSAVALSRSQDVLRDQEKLLKFDPDKYHGSKHERRPNIHSP